MMLSTFLYGMSRLTEPRHDKTNKMSVRPAKTQISLGICPVWSGLLHEESLGPYLPIEHTTKTLIILGRCPGWSESSLGAQPHCWFCHVAAQLLKCNGCSTTCIGAYLIWLCYCTNAPINVLPQRGRRGTLSQGRDLRFFSEKISKKLCLNLKARTMDFGHKIVSHG